MEITDLAIQIEIIISMNRIVDQIITIPIAAILTIIGQMVQIISLIGQIIKTITTRTEHTGG